MEKEFDFKNIGKRMPYRTPDGFFGKMQKKTPCLQCVKEVFPYGYGSECKGRLHPRYDERDGV